MTYKEKYDELFKDLEAGTKEFKLPVNFPTEINNEQGKSDIAAFHHTASKFQTAYTCFEQLLAYMFHGNVDPNMEYQEKEFMYACITTDLKRMEKHLTDTDSDPWTSSLYYDCAMTVTDHPNHIEDIRCVSFLFPVLNLTRGRECADYLAGGFQQDPAWSIGIKVTENINIGKSQPIYLRVTLRAN